jgi:hypothetical protein
MQFVMCNHDTTVHHAAKLTRHGITSYARHVTMH